MGLCKMMVDKLGIDLAAHDPVVILTDEDRLHSLPIAIGVFEATAIALAIEKRHPQRPISHDLIKSLLELLEAHLERVEIYDVRNSTFYARMIIETGDKTITLDSRPSDSIAVALRTNAPIYADTKVLAAAGIRDLDIRAEEDVPEEDLSDLPTDGPSSTQSTTSAERESASPPPVRASSLNDANFKDFINNLRPSDLMD